jgi:hypothetical protein
MQLLTALYYFIFIGLPTLLFYGWIVLFGGYAIRQLRAGRSKAKAAALGGVALVPLVLFGVTYLTEMNRVRRLETVVREAAALPKLANPPRTLVVHGGRWETQDQLVEMGAFDEVYVTWNGKTVKLANHRHAGFDGGNLHSIPSQNIFRARMGYLVRATETPSDSYPRDGLHFVTGRTRYDPRPPDWQNEYELKWIEAGSETRIGYFGRLQTYTPILPPVLSIMGFVTRDETLGQIVPWYGEVPFLVERLGLKPEHLKPAEQPSPEAVRAEYLRLRDSQNRIDQVIAGYIATAVGRAALTADDIAPVLASNVIDSDFGRELGFEQFCNHIDRLCDFQDLMISACKANRAHIPESSGYRAGALRRCERIPTMCTFCRTTQRCDYYRTGETAGCSQQEAAARDEVLRPIREAKD